MDALADDFDTFFKARYAGLVHALFVSTGDLGRAEECAQEAFIRAWQRWSSLRKDDAQAWVLRVAWRLAVDDWRSGQRRMRRQQAYWGDRRTQPSVDDSASQLDMRSEVSDALNKAPLDQRRILALHYLLDMSVEAISSLLNLPTGTVKSRLARGRTTIRAQLGEMDESK